MGPRLAPGVVMMALALAPVSAAAQLDDFGRCLARAGAAYYAVSWCPHCAVQDETLGSAVEYVRIECSAGPRGRNPDCVAEGIGSYPTWTFADGSRVSGVASLDLLGRKTGCSLTPAKPRTQGAPQEAPVTRRSGSTWTRERHVGGAKIIDILGR